MKKYVSLVAVIRDLKDLSRVLIHDLESSKKI